VEPYQYFLLGMMAAWTPSMTITALLYMRPLHFENQGDGSQQ
jgi:hypothetical protein